jgi:hypothetical protein
LLSYGSLLKECAGIAFRDSTSFDNESRFLALIGCDAGFVVFELISILTVTATVGIRQIIGFHYFASS